MCSIDLPAEDVVERAHEDVSSLCFQTLETLHFAVLVKHLFISKGEGERVKVSLYRKQKISRCYAQTREHEP